MSGDQTVAAHHAIIRDEGRNSSVSQAGGGQELINRRSVAGRQAVWSGERIDIGGNLFVFASAHRARRPKEYRAITRKRSAVAYVCARGCDRDNRRGMRDYGPARNRERAADFGRDAFVLSVSGQRISERIIRAGEVLVLMPA